MSQAVKFTVTDGQLANLRKRAEDAGLSVQDYIRLELFQEQNALTPREAVERALKQYGKGDTFTVPELCGDDWILPNGIAGQFGKKFLHLVETSYANQIIFTKRFDEKKHAIYQIL